MKLFLALIRMKVWKPGGERDQLEREKKKKPKQKLDWAIWKFLFHIFRLCYYKLTALKNSYFDLQKAAISPIKDKYKPAHINN